MGGGGGGGVAQIMPNTMIIAAPLRFSDPPTALLAMQAAAELHDGQRRQCLCLETSSTSPLLREKKSRKVAQIQLHAISLICQLWSTIILSTM